MSSLSLSPRAESHFRFYALGQRIIFPLQTKQNDVESREARSLLSTITTIQYDGDAA